MSVKEFIKTAQYGFFEETAKKTPPTLGAEKGRQTAGPLKMPKSLSTAHATGGRGFQGAPVSERSPGMPGGSPLQQYAAQQAKTMAAGGRPIGVSGGGGSPMQAKPGITGGQVASAARGGQFNVAGKTYTPGKKEYTVKKASAKELIKSAQGLATVGSQQAKSLLGKAPTAGGAVGAGAKQGFMGAAKSFKPPTQQPSFGFSATAPPKYGG